MERMKLNVKGMSQLMIVIFLLLGNFAISENFKGQFIPPAVQAEAQFGQQSPSPVLITGNTEWQLIKSDKLMKLYSREVDCIDTENGISMKLVLLRVENLSSVELTMSWDNKLYYDNECKTCEGNRAENHIVVNVPPKRTVEGSCTSGDFDLSLFAQMLNSESESLTSFELANLKVTSNR